MQQTAITYVTNQPLAPDRIRSFLDQLAQYCNNWSWRQMNLYALSDQWSNLADQAQEELSGTLQAGELPFRICIQKKGSQNFLALSMPTIDRSTHRFSLFLLWELLNLGVKMMPAEMAWLQIQASSTGAANTALDKPALLWLSNTQTMEQALPQENLEVLYEQSGGKLLVAKDFQEEIQQSLASMQVESTDTSLFERLSIAAKCQVLRWFLADYKQANPAIIRTIEKALSDSHWEVSITAMIVAVRFRLNHLAASIKKLNLPTTSRSGLNSKERSMLLGMKKAALHLLEGGTIPKNDPGTLDRKAQRFDHLLQCVSGKYIQQFETVFLLTKALTTPAAEAPLPQESFLGKFIVSGRRVYLRESGVEVVHVPPGNYWLGYDQGPDFPAREVSLKRGFMIAKYPVIKETLIYNYVRDLRPEDFYQENSYRLFTVAEAESYCQRLSQEEGLEIAIPTCEEWEMAARGQTAAWFPWGNSYHRGMLRESAPVDAEAMAGIIPQWAKHADQDVWVGGQDQYARTYQHLQPTREKTALRFIIRF